MEKGSSSITVEREVDGGLESLKLQLPAVITYVSFELIYHMFYKPMITIHKENLPQNLLHTFASLIM